MLKEKDAADSNNDQIITITITIKVGKCLFLLHLESDY